MSEAGELTPTQQLWWSDERVDEELYDLVNDPDEVNNLATDPAFATILEEHRQTLADWVEATGDQGQTTEPPGSLRGVLKQWKRKAVNPEYDTIRGVPAGAGAD